jgi:hypothetical protein
MPSPVVHFEIRSADPDATRSFFGKLFGWTFPDGGMPGYSYVDTGVEGAIPGGISPLQDGEPLVTLARGSVRATAGEPQPSITVPRVQQLLQRYLRAWELADIDGFVQLVSEDVRFSMPPLTAWFEGRDAVAAFIENAIFAPARPHGVPLRAGSCNGQPAFATYEPDSQGHLVISGLQILQLGNLQGRPLITALVSYRDPALAIRCGLPPALS